MYSIFFPYPLPLISFKIILLLNAPHNFGYMKEKTRDP